MEDYIDEAVETAIDSKPESDAGHSTITSWPIYATISLGFVGMSREAGPLMLIPAAGFGLAGARGFLKEKGYDPRDIAGRIYHKLMGKN